MLVKCALDKMNREPIQYEVISPETSWLNTDYGGEEL